MPDLSESFNSDYQAVRVNSNVLRVSYGRTHYDYDFVSRMLVLKDYEGTTKMAVLPFAQLDPEVVVAMHDKLVELGGTPPALPMTLVKSPPAQPRKLNP